MAIATNWRLERELSLEETAQAIEEIRSIDGMVWNFQKLFRFNDANIETLREKLHQELAARLGLPSEEVTDSSFYIGRRDIQLIDGEPTVVISSPFSHMSGYEIVKRGYQYGFAYPSNIAIDVSLKSLVELVPRHLRGEGALEIPKYLLALIDWPSHTKLTDEIRVQLRAYYNTFFKKFFGK